MYLSKQPTRSNALKSINPGLNVNQSLSLKATWHETLPPSEISKQQPAIKNGEGIKDSFMLVDKYVISKQIGDLF